MRTPSGWTDLIYAGSQRIATVAGTQTAAPIYDVVDHVGSEVATVNGGTGAQSSLDYTPYGQVLNGTNSDGFIFTGLQRDPDGLDHADMRQYTSTAGRWITSDPYSGSYDIENPQSLNRYAYVNNNPLGFVDPSGEVDGWANGLGGGPCSQLHRHLNWDTTFDLPGGGVLNPCAPLASAIADGIYYGVSELAKDGFFNGIDASVGLSAKASKELLSDSLAWVGFGVSIACSIDSGTNACGEKGWASIFVKGNAAKVIDDSLSLVGAIAATTCAAGNGVGCAIALGYAIYSGLNDLFGVLWSEFGPAPFKGSLLPRPGVRGGLGNTLTGVPNQSSLANSTLGATSLRN